MHRYSEPQYHYFYGGGVGLLIGLIVLGLLVYALVVVIKKAREQDLGTSGRGISGPATASGLLTPIDIVKMRYARGEISRTEFETMREDLG